MSSRFIAIMDQVSELSRAEQLAVIEAIAHLLKESESEKFKLSPEWEKELDRRDVLLDSGEMPLYTWKEVKDRIISRNKKN